MSAWTTTSPMTWGMGAPSVTYKSIPDFIATSLSFAAGVAHERGRNIATNTRRSTASRERALLAEGMRLLAVGPFGARQAAWLIAGYVEGAESVAQGVAS